ncbi:hypothetical protein LDENG_00112400 [Lucifuga dentata]|nr:hypothetical protein LDENG_00112400 [Lucifuga dentata]
MTNTCSITTTSPSRQRKYHFTLCGRKKKNEVIRGKLRIRSVPGAFLVLGVVVVAVGTALAVVGYWPYRTSRLSVLGAAEAGSISESQTSGWSLGAQSFLSAGFLHGERMKLLGPVIMGVGLFILICANTVLYENRDRETQMLLAQMRSVICSVSVAAPVADLKDIAIVNSMAKHQQWLSSLPAAQLNFLCLQQLTCSEPLLQTPHLRDQEDQADRVEDIYQPVLQTEALHHQESHSSPSCHSSHSTSCNSSQADFNVQAGAECGGRTSSIPQPAPLSSTLQPAPLSKFSSCLVSASSMSTLGGEDVEVPATPPRRCLSLSHRTNPYKVPTAIPVAEALHELGSGGGLANQCVVLSRESGSQIGVNIPEQVLDGVEQQNHGSWTRLDLASRRRYLKLENKEDSVDKLLEQVEQRCSQWIQDFGSGSFQ